MKFLEDIIPHKVVNALTNDMLIQLLSKIPAQDVPKVLDFYKIDVNEQGVITSLPFDSFYILLSYYTRAIEIIFKYDENTINEMKAFESNVLTKKEYFGHPQFEVDIFSRFINRLSDPLQRFFAKNLLGEDRDIANHLSLLPPVIRVAILNGLLLNIRNYLKDGNTLPPIFLQTVADKLNLAIIKLDDIKISYNWVQENRDILEAIDMYDTCVQKIQAFDNGSKAEYTTFSEAYVQYKQKWRLAPSTPVRAEFSEIVKIMYQLPEIACELLLHDIKR